MSRNYHAVLLAAVMITGLLALANLIFNEEPRGLHPTDRQELKERHEFVMSKLAGLLTDMRSIEKKIDVINKLGEEGPLRARLGEEWAQSKWSAWVISGTDSVAEARAELLDRKNDVEEVWYDHLTSQLNFLDYVQTYGLVLRVDEFRCEPAGSKHIYFEWYVNGQSIDKSEKFRLQSGGLLEDAHQKSIEIPIEGTVFQEDGELRIVVYRDRWRGDVALFRGTTDIDVFTPWRLGRVMDKSGDAFKIQSNSGIPFMEPTGSVKSTHGASINFSVHAAPPVDGTLIP